MNKINKWVKNLWESLKKDSGMDIYHFGILGKKPPVKKKAKAKTNLKKTKKKSTKKKS